MDFALAPETLTGARPAVFLRCAAKAAFRHVGLRVIEGHGEIGDGDVVPSLVRSAAAVVEVGHILDGEGLRVTELEWVGLDGTNDINAFRPGLEIGARFGGRHLCAVSTDPDPIRAVDAFAALCALAAEHGMIVDIEFVPFTAVRTIAEAATLVRASRAANAGILLDAMHWLRGGGTIADIVPHGALVRQVQLCDAPTEAPASKGDRIRETLQARLLPGEGGCDLAALLAVAQPAVPFSLEVPNRARLAEEGAVHYARRVHDAARRVSSGAACDLC
jgi:sugar phosphate isomerase/epimerase